VRTIAIAILLLLPALARAQASVPAPRLLPYQGRLLRADGTPEKETQRLTFRVYAAPDAPSALWSEAQDVPLTNGFYAVFLGSVSVFPDTLFDGHDRWMGVTVGDGPELTPRQQIASVAYAIMATSALRASTADQATTAATATRATAADRAASADYARTAGSAATADTATRTTRAEHAATADSATTAITATSLSGTGDVTAASVNASVGLTVAATTSLTRDGLITPGMLTAATLNVSKVLHAPGTVVGGAVASNVCTNWVTQQPPTGGPIQACMAYGWACSNWGDGLCDGQGGVNCDGGTHETGYVRGVMRQGFCIQP
jgi:hypothetical protein